MATFVVLFVLRFDLFLYDMSFQLLTGVFITPSANAQLFVVDFVIEQQCRKLSGPRQTHILSPKVSAIVRTDDDNTTPETHFSS
jgi:hypothetical protein